MVMRLMNCDLVLSGCIQVHSRCINSAAHDITRLALLRRDKRPYAG